jgi:hypothetical protein
MVKRGNIFEQVIALDEFGDPVRFGDPGCGESRVDPQIQKWVDAFDAFEDGDKAALVALLKSGHPIPAVIVPHIGDLLERWDMVRPKHRMRIPSYRLTDNELKLHMANCEVDDLMSSGLVSLSDAIKEVAALYAEFGIKETVLSEYHGKRRGDDRRVKARGYPHKRRGPKQA